MTALQFDSIIDDEIRHVEDQQVLDMDLSETVDVNMHAFTLHMQLIEVRHFPAF